jgi:hypothetical protein
VHCLWQDEQPRTTSSSKKQFGPGALAILAHWFYLGPRQQLKDQAQVDSWLRDGSAAYVEALCDWN